MWPESKKIPFRIDPYAHRKLLKLWIRPKRYSAQTAASIDPARSRSRQMTKSSGKHANDDDSKISGIIKVVRKRMSVMN